MVESIVLAQFLRPVPIASNTLPLLTVTLFFVVVLPIVRFLLTRLLFRPLGRSRLPKPSENGSADKAHSKQTSTTSSAIEKWEMACWSFVFYLVAALANFYVVSQERWFTKPARLWYHCTMIPCETPIATGVLIMYALQLGYYAQAVPSLIIWDLKRKDFCQMLIHHIATIGLIAYSIRTNFMQSGAMILLTHDVCDVFMEAAKIFRYLEYNRASTIIFSIFVLVWIAMRVIYFPIWLIRSCMRDTLGYLAIPYDLDPEPHYIFLNGLLTLLYCIHLYWTYLILKIVWSVVVLSKEVDDVREEEDNNPQQKKEN